MSDSDCTETHGDLEITSNRGNVLIHSKSKDIHTISHDDTTIESKQGSLHLRCPKDSIMCHSKRLVVNSKDIELNDLNISTTSNTIQINTLSDKCLDITSELFVQGKAITKFIQSTDTQYTQLLDNQKQIMMRLQSIQQEIQKLHTLIKKNEHLNKHRFNQLLTTATTTPTSVSSSPTVPPHEEDK